MGGRAGFADEIINRYPRAARAWFDVELGVIDAPWENKAVEDETPAEAKLRGQLDGILKHEMRTDLGQTVAGLQGGWSKFLINAASTLKYGSAPFERTWWDDASTTHGDGMRLELFHIHPSSIYEYTDDADGYGLASIKQQVDGGTHTIPAERLVMVTPMGASGEYEGWTPMRSLGFIVELAWQLAHSTARRARLDSGIFAMEETQPGAGEQSIDEIEQALDELEAGQQLSAYIPEGMQLKFHSPSSSGTNPVEIWKYVDGQVDHVIGAWVASLGLTSGSSSQALGETLSIQDSKRWRRVLNMIGSGISTMYRDLAADLGYTDDVRVPSLCVRELDDMVDPIQLSQSIQAGVAAGILPVVPELTRELAERAGLSEETVNAMVRAQTQAVEPPPVADPELPPPPTAPNFAENAPQSDFSGKPIDFFRELADVERIVEWTDNDDRRADMESDYQRLLSVVRDEHVEDLREVLSEAGGLTEQERQQLIAVVLSQYIDRYTEVILDHVFAVEQATEAAGERERSRAQPVAGGSTPEAAQELRNMAAAQIASMRQGIERQGEIAARRVQGDVLDQFEAQAPIASIASRVGGPGLARHGSQIANRAEGMGRIVGAALRGPSEGLVPVEAFRTSVNDKNRCGTCKRRDSGQSGKTWSLRTAEEVQQFIDDPDATTPDPDCDGMTNCRCGHLIRYARGPRLDMSTHVIRFASLSDIEAHLRG